MSSDPTIDRIRAQLAEHDQAVLDAVNARLRLVAELKRHKQDAGIPFADPEQERRLLERLTAASSGPLSEQGVRELFEMILALTKRELET